MKETIKKIPGIRALLKRLRNDEREIEYLKQLLYLSYQPEEYIRTTALYKHALQIKKMLIIKEPVEKDSNESAHGFVRVGRHNDGGYIMYNEFKNATIAYSFGISDDVSWDMDMANKGYDVYMYDHTIKSLPRGCENEITTKFHFFKIGLYSKNIGKFKTLEELLIQNGHMEENKMVLKVDIEGCEWEVLSKIDVYILYKFNQIVIEYHSIEKTDNLEMIKKALENINKTHQLVHIHANNCGKIFKLGDIVLPNTLEATYLNKSYYDFKESEKVFPTELDESCKAGFGDVYLGKWNI